MGPPLSGCYSHQQSVEMNGVPRPFATLSAKGGADEDTASKALLISVGQSISTNACRCCLLWLALPMLFGNTCPDPAKNKTFLTEMRGELVDETACWQSLLRTLRPSRDRTGQDQQPTERRYDSQDPTVTYS